MEFEWDPDKAAFNHRKHRVSFPFATGVFADPDRQEKLDARENYGEDRWLVLGRAGEFLLVVVYTVRGSKIRLISARKADGKDYEIFY